MKKLATLVFIPVLLIATFLGVASAKRTYQGDHLTIHKVAVQEDGTIQIAFSPLVETMWHCPGADAVETEDGLLIRFLKVGFKKKPEVDYPATDGELDGKPVKNITLPKGTKAVFYQDGKERRKLFPTDS